MNNGTEQRHTDIETHQSAEQYLLKDLSLLGSADPAEVAKGVAALSNLNTKIAEENGEPLTSEQKSNWVRRAADIVASAFEPRPTAGTWQPAQQEEFRHTLRNLGVLPPENLTVTPPTEPVVPPHQVIPPKPGV